MIKKEYYVNDVLQKTVRIYNEKGQTDVTITTDTRGAYQQQVIGDTEIWVNSTHYTYKYSNQTVKVVKIDDGSFDMSHSTGERVQKSASGVSTTTSATTTTVPTMLR